MREETQPSSDENGNAARVGDRLGWAALVAVGVMTVSYSIGVNGVRRDLPQLPAQQASFRGGRCRARTPLPIRHSADYRNFLLLDGSGGAGPGYGLWPLGLGDPPDQKLETWDAGSWTDHPSQPFPHTSAWNLPQELMAASPSAEASWEELGAYLPLVEAATWAPGVADGAIPIANLGCAIRLLLIVNGPERGHIWIDDRASDGGIYPATTEEHPSRMTFDEVFGDWLEQGRRTATTSHRTPRPW